MRSQTSPSWKLDHNKIIHFLCNIIHNVVKAFFYQYSYQVCIKVFFFKKYILQGTCWNQTSLTSTVVFEMDRCSVYIQVKFTKISTFGLYVLIQGSVWTYFTVYILGKNLNSFIIWEILRKFFQLKKKRHVIEYSWGQGHT